MDLVLRALAIITEDLVSSLIVRYFGTVVTDQLFDSRVAELEQENARLLASIQQQAPSSSSSSSSPSSSDDDGLKSELEQLRRQLAETQQRERELAEKLSSAPTPQKLDVVKMEQVEPQLPVSLRAHKGERSGASFGLMVSPLPRLHYICLQRDSSPRSYYARSLRSSQCPRTTRCRAACRSTPPTRIRTLPRSI